MKKKHFIVFMICFVLACLWMSISSCSQATPKNIPVTYDSVSNTWDINDEMTVGLIRVDGCQYFISNQYGRTSLTHKGNCDNPVHLDQQFKATEDSDAHYNTAPNHSRIP